MNTAEQLERKRQRNREYYERNKERIKQRQRERYYQLKLVEQAPLVEELQQTDNTEPTQFCFRRTKIKKPFEYPKIQRAQFCARWKPTDTKGSPQNCGQRKYNVQRPRKPLKILNSQGSSSAELVWQSEELGFFGNYSEWKSEETSTELTIECLRGLGMNYQIQAYKCPENVTVLSNEENLLKTEVSIWDQVFQPEYFFRILFSIGMTIFLIFLQIEFYEKHDSTAYPVAMAIACELSLICLALTKFRCSGSERLRKLVFSSLFLYVIGSLSFSVYSEARLDSSYTVSEVVPKDERSKLERRLATAELALEKATIGRSWDNMTLFGKQVTDIQIQIETLETKTSLGVTDNFMSAIQALLLIILRASLLIVNSINAAKLREDFFTAPAKPGRKFGGRS